MKSSNKRTIKYFPIFLALATGLFLNSCSSCDKESCKKVGAETAVIPVDQGHDAHGHEGHDHGAHEGHHHGQEAESTENMEGMESLGAGDLNYAEGTWGHSVMSYMDSDADAQTFILDKIPFEGEDLDEAAKEQLDDLAALLKAYPNTRLIVKGHTKEAKNAVGRQTKKATSKARALWVQAKLSLRGVPSSQMRARGMADEELLSDYAGDASEQRRIEAEFKKSAE